MDELADFVASTCYRNTSSPPCHRRHDGGHGGDSVGGDSSREGDSDSGGDSDRAGDSEGGGSSGGTGAGEGWRTAGGAAGGAARRNSRYPLLILLLLLP